MFGEHGERPPVLGKVADLQTIVGDERTQCRRELVQEEPRLKLRVERSPDGREADKEIAVLRHRLSA
jgi:hypothetical protein